MHFASWESTKEATVALGYRVEQLLLNISNTRDSVSSGYPNTDKIIENKTRSGVLLTIGVRAPLDLGGR